MADSSALSLIGLLVSLITKCWNFWKSLFNFFLTDGIMYMSGKAYKPTDPGTVEVLIKELLPLLGARRDWTFVDLGCGQGGMLTAMRNGAAGPMFERVIGVELDEDTHRQAVKKVNDPSIEVVCGDMFAYVKKACAQQKLLSGRAVFYMYEPLWAANMPKKVRDELYDGLLGAVGAHAGSMVVYITGVVQMHERHIEQAALKRGGLSIKHSARVSQSGVANNLSGTYNTLEIWSVDESKAAPRAANSENVALN